MWAVLWGNGRAEIDRDRDGKIVALLPLHPARTKSETREDGSLWHIIDNMDGTHTELPDRNVFHVQGLSEDGSCGISVLGKARQSLGLAVSAEDYGLRFFDNNARPSILLKHPSKLTPEAKANLKASWATAFGGKKRHGTAVIEEGMDVTVLGMPNEDAQFLQTRQFQIIEIARWFNIPPHKLRDLERATFSNIVEQSLEFVGDTILPWAVDWEQEANRKLFREDDRGRFFAEFMLDALLRADPKSRNEAYEIQRRNGVLNADTWRARENMNPIGGPEGEMYIVAANMVNVKTLASGDVADPPGQQRNDGEDSQATAIAKAYIPVFADVIYRMFRVESNAANRASKKGVDMDSWIIEYFDGHLPTFRSALIPCVESLGAAVRTVMAYDFTSEDWDVLVGTFTKTSTHDHATWASVELCREENDDDTIRTKCAARAHDLVMLFVELAQEKYT